MRLKLFIGILFSLLLCGIYSCKDETVTPNGLEGSSKNYSIGSVGGIVPLEKFTTHRAWSSFIKYTSVSGWVKLSQTNGGSGEFAVTATVLPNESEEGRSAVIIISCGRNSLEYTITQVGKNDNDDPVKPDIPEEPDEPENPDNPDDPDKGYEMLAFDYVSGVKCLEYNYEGQITSTKDLTFEYDAEGKIIKAISIENLFKREFAVSYTATAMTISGDLDECSQIKSGKLTAIGNIPIEYSGGTIAAGQWQSEYKTEKLQTITNGKMSASFVYDNVLPVISKASIDLSQLMAATLLENISAGRLLYLQRFLHRGVRQEHYLQSSAQTDDNKYQYIFRYDDKKRVSSITEYNMPADARSWRTRCVEISYLNQSE